VKFIKDLGRVDRHRALMFVAEDRLILAAWNPRPRGPTVAMSWPAGNENLAITAMDGRPIDTALGKHRLSTAPVYAEAKGMKVQELEALMEFAGTSR
jgi:hypothetical protein